MPPLPSTTQSLTNRLNALSESNKASLQLIQRLSKLEFQPGSVPLISEERDSRLELSAEIHEGLKQSEEELDLLRQEVEDVVQGTASLSRRREGARESERSRLAVLLARLTEDLKLSRSQFRKAQLTAKRNADRAKLKERELLFSDIQSGSTTPNSAHRRKHNSQLTEQEVITDASSDVTAALRRTQQLMQSELSRSRFAQETLEQSTAALAEVGEKYTDLNTLLANSRTLVTTLLQSQKSDTWYLETTLYILITTVIWLVFRRWFYGPLSWFVFLPLKLVFRVLLAIIPSTGLGASSSVSTSQSLSTSLIVKPRASRGFPKHPTGNSQQQQPYIRVGGGGRGYNPDPSPPGSVSQEIGQMAEQNQDQAQEHPQLREQQQQSDAQQEPVVRGDGTVLQERDKPKNPKKKMWEEDVETAKHEQEQAEHSQKQQDGGRGERNEL